MTHLDRIVELN